VHLYVSKSFIKVNFLHLQYFINVYTVTISEDFGVKFNVLLIYLNTCVVKYAATGTV